jgi:hypothetical protein
LARRRTRALLHFNAAALARGLARGARTALRCSSALRWLPTTTRTLPCYHLPLPAILSFLA